MINSNSYYYLITHSQILQKYIGVKIEQNNKIKNLYLDKEPNDNVIWKFLLSQRQSCYYIINCLSGLVLQVDFEGQIGMHHLKYKQNQLFNINLNLDKTEIIINDSHFNNILVIQNGKFVCIKQNKNVQNKKYKLIIKKANDHDSILNSFRIMCNYTGYALQVHDLGQKDGAKLQKNQWIGYFSQRWLIQTKQQKGKPFLILRNLRSKKIATIKGTKLKDQLNIVQYNEHLNHHFQLWSIQQKGYQLFSIRSAFSEELFIGTKDRSIKVNSQVVLVKNQSQHLWKISGHF